MESGLSPEIAIRPTEFTQLYEDAQRFDERQKQLEASFALLSMGRLGLRPAELIHFHEGWIDWPAGAFRVPEFDSCACHYCWQWAKRNKQQFYRKQVDEIVAEHCWSPGEGDARTISFGWSNRLTGTIGTFFEQHEYLDYDINGLRELLFEVAATTQLQRNWLSPAMLRSSALSFLAAAGCSEQILVELTGVDAPTASEFASAVGTPDQGQTESEYPLVTTTSQGAREPFDPTDFDSDWRIQRSVGADDIPANPRPVVTPDGISLSAEELVESEQDSLDFDTSVVATDLDGWITAVTDRHAESEGEDAATDTESTSADAETTDESHEDTGRTADADDQERTGPVLVEPVDFSIDTRFAPDSTPTGGSVILTPEGLIFLSQSDTGIDGILQIDWENIEDLAPGYAPDEIADHFDETIGLAYSDDTAGRRIVVWEVPRDIQSTFTRQLFTYLLEDMRVVVSGLEVDSEPLMGEKMQLRVSDSTLEFTKPGSEIAAELPLSSILDVNEADLTQVEADGTELEIQQLADGNRVNKITLQAIDARKQKLLQRLLLLQLKPKRRKAHELNLGKEHRDVLSALYKLDRGQRLRSLIDMEPRRLVGIVTVLKSNDLVRDCSFGIQLTTTGFLILRNNSAIERS